MKNILLTLFIFAFIQVNAATYHVKTGGNDTNSGLTDALSWETIAKVNSSTFSAGDSILFKRGDTWRGTITIPSSGALGNNITFSSYGTGNKPIILGSLAVTTWADQGGNVWKSSSTIADPYHDSYTNLTGNVFFIDGDGTVHTGIKEASIGALTADYEGYWSANYLYVYSTSDPGTRFSSVEATIQRGCIFLNTKEYIEINGIDLFYAQWAGVYAQWSPTLDKNGFIMRNCESAYHGYPDGDFGYGAHIAYSNSLFENNTIHDCGRRGISLMIDRAYMVENIIIQNNYFYNGYHTASVDLETSDANASSYNGVIIRNNISDGEKVIGAPSVPVGMFISNQSTGTANNIEIYSNIFKHSTGGGGLQVDNIQSANIYNNTFSEFDTTYAWAFHLYFSNGCTNIDVKNNIFYTTSATAGFGQSIYLTATQLSTGISSDYNLFYRTASNGSIIHTETADYTFANKATIISGLGWETHSVFSNPNFISTSDLQLQTGSPAINTGVNVGLTSDYRGYHFIGLPDIGAYEYGATGVLKGISAGNGKCWGVGGVAYGY